MSRYRVCHTLRFLAGMFFLCIGSQAQAAESAFHMFENAGEPLTIGDIKPTFMVYDDKGAPEVTVEQVLKRYQKLYEKATSPDVRLDVINRINNLCEKNNLSCKNLSMDQMQQNKLIIESANAIMDRGIFYQRMDELMYTWAKALNFMGQKDETVKRLKMLIGLYPKSELVDEARFRLGEAHFDLQQFSEAEAAYKAVLGFSSSSEFHHKARFKLGWAVFRQDRFPEASKHAIQVLDAYPELRAQTSIEKVKPEDQDLVEDTLRLLAIMISRQKGSKSIEALQKNIGHQQYAYLLYDSLLRLYLKQDRFEDAALVASAYPVHYPDDFNAWSMAQNAIMVYQKGRFDIKEWQAKQDFVANFGVKSHFWSGRSDQEKEVIRPYLVTYLDELAHLYYVRMQQSQKSAEKKNLVERASRASAYYLQLADTSQDKSKHGEYVLLAADALYLSGQIEQSIALYERSAYQEMAHPNAAKAGYAAIAAYDLLRDRNPAAQTAEKSQARSVSIDNFAKFFPDDEHTPGLLSLLAGEAHEAGNHTYAESLSARVLAYPKLEPKIRYASQLVNAHSHFALEQFPQAEAGYQAALGLPESAKDKSNLQERMAAAIFKQAEKEPDQQRSAELYLKVVDATPNSSIVPQALYDASAQYLAAQNWPKAIATLRHFQQAFPGHELQPDASDKLVFAYMQSGDKLAAAELLVDIAKTTPDQEKSVNAMFQAADMYREGDLLFEANQLYENFIARHPDQFALAVEAHDHVIRFYHKEGKADLERDWKKRLISYEAKHVSERTDRSAALAARASFDLAMDEYQRYAAAKLKLPLKESLAIKKKHLQDAIAAFEQVAAYGVSEYLTASTFQIASMYQTMATDLINSERPKDLDELQNEQYGILLEEQAFTFEEQAMEVFRINLARGSDGVYDTWIKQTYEVLAQMNPAEYQRQFKRVEYAPDFY